MMWAAGVLASVSSITYPAISAFVSMHSDADKQGKQRAGPAQHVFTCIVTNLIYKMFYCDNFKIRTWHLPYIRGLEL